MAIVTSDNPRDEDPAAIAEQVLSGAREVADADVRVELDRRAAIELAVREARPGDVVLLAGKGHEAVQTTGGETRAFSDRDVAAEAVRGSRES